MPTARVAIVTLLLLAGATTSVRAQGTIEAAARLYSSAAYDEALEVLDGLPTDWVDVKSRVAINHYRMLCLLALGRTAEADAAIVALLALHPAYTISDDEVSPRVVRVFRDARRRALPVLIRQRYDAARALQAAGDHAGATTAFAVVRSLLADEMAASDPALTSLAAQMEREDLASRQALADAERTASAEAAAIAPPAAELPPDPSSPVASPAVTSPTPAAPDAASSAPPPASAPPGGEPARSPAARPAPADGIYSMADPGVIAPVVVRQDLRRWFGPLGPPPAGTVLGRVRFVVDESGAVIDFEVVNSVSAFYDLVLEESVPSWRYRPATRNGQPVKFRREMTLLSR